MALSLSYMVGDYLLHRNPRIFLVIIGCHDNAHHAMLFSRIYQLEATYGESADRGSV